MLGVIGVTQALPYVQISNAPTNASSPHNLTHRVSPAINVPPMEPVISGISVSPS